MSTRVFDIKHYRHLYGLKLEILQRLKLIKHKKDSVADFNMRMNEYLQRNTTTTIILRVARAAVEQNLQFYLREGEPFPEGYEFGSPHNRWIFWDSSLPEGEQQRRKSETNRKVEAAWVELNDFLNGIKQLDRVEVEIV